MRVSSDAQYFKFEEFNYVVWGYQFSMYPGEFGDKAGLGNVLKYSLFWHITPPPL